MGHQENLKSRTTSTSRISPSSSSCSTSFRDTSPILTGLGAGKSSLLQERLRERHSERRKSISFGDGVISSSPVRSVQIREDRRPSSSGLCVRGMGVKQWEEQTSTLHKQNYNLKLELFHRRDRQTKLEAELVAAQKTIEENSECQKINELLISEIDRRDQAVDEAINLITCLEEQIELLKVENQRLRQAHDDERLSSDEFNQPFDSQQQSACSSPILAGQISKPRSLPRVPSFLSDQSEGTEALRSLYTKFPAPSESTLSKLEEEEAEDSNDAIDSPRLSVLSRLSKSSFISVYGNNNDHKIESLVEDDKKQESSVLNWVENSQSSDFMIPLTPQVQKTQFRSLDSAFRVPTYQRSGQTTVHPTNRLVVNTQPISSRSNPGRFDDRHTLPPTPDTFCTMKLRVSPRNSTEAFDQENEVLSQQDSDSLRVSLPARPQSLCETVMSRCDDHGWHTSSETDTGSVVREADNHDYSRPRRIKTPILFTFDEPQWDRSIFYHHEPTFSYPYPPVGASLDANNDIICKSSAAESFESCKYDPRINLTATNLPLEYRQNPYPVISRVSRPMIEKQSNVANVHTIATTNTLSPVWKRNPISLTLARFRRNDNSSVNSQTPVARSKQALRASDSVSNQVVTSRDATPPPILRHRDVTPIFQPLSVGNAVNFRNDGPKDVIQDQREQRYRRVSSCTSNTVSSREVQLNEVEREEENSGGRSVRKWLGLGVGRSNSMRRS